ncbi:hypothetical protein [Bradyrhizobium sp.]|uniref:hypothetical protein n=1 Tax=Bradyrhizobium sp. TaxID=376 RepID=UPI002DDCEC65|nr:hypothetical protein [Bradyrhizobium sp.]HEV2155447.1 hypothetical protein [Bradyrhizobium sp.]
MTDDLIARLNGLHFAGKMHGFSLWPSQGGYQANLAVGSNSWRIRNGATPGEAIAELLSDTPGLEVSDAEMVSAREVFEPELPDPEDSVFG